MSILVRAVMIVPTIFSGLLGTILILGGDALGITAGLLLVVTATMFASVYHWMTGIMSYDPSLEEEYRKREWAEYTRQVRVRQQSIDIYLHCNCPNRLTTRGRLAAVGVES